MSRINNLRMERGRLITLNVVVVLVMMGMGMVGPILPLYGRTFGATTTMVGILITSFGLARIVIDLPAGILLEKHGRRIILLVGPLLMAVGSLLCGLATSFAQLVVWRFIQGAGSALYTTAAMTVVADISTPANRGRNMSFYQGSILIGTGLGPTLGGALAGQTGSYRLPFFVFALLTLLAAIWVWLMLPETQDYGRTDLNSGHVGHLSSMSPRFLLTDLNFLLVGVINFGIFFSRAGTQMELLPLIGAEEVGLNPEQIGVALTFAAVANFFVLSPAGWIADRFSRKIAIVPANLVMGLSLVVFIYTDNYLMFLLAVILYGIASGFGGPAPAAYVADIVPRHAYGLAMGTVRTFGDLGFVVAPMVLGWLSDLHSYDLALWFNALLMSGSALAFGLWAREKRAKTE